MIHYKYKIPSNKDGWSESWLWISPFRLIEESHFECHKFRLGSIEYTEYTPEFKKHHERELIVYKLSTGPS